jgi:hypothetical protein
MEIEGRLVGGDVRFFVFRILLKCCSMIIKLVSRQPEGIAFLLIHNRKRPNPTQRGESPSIINTTVYNILCAARCVVRDQAPRSERLMIHQVQGSTTFPRVEMALEAPKPFGTVWPRSPKTVWGCVWHGFHDREHLHLIIGNVRHRDAEHHADFIQAWSITTKEILVCSGADTIFWV